ncbi:PCP degradation transcriptional activation protein [BD1-7 clade bacterium]|uniref:PCP degradation transcriptional activation protein n=1 Tax=BD1-7 clade bacterium TaxID=2029982 RepID=A0A5S9PFX9_9GAMM|nr:PCP degradation transcriptional activation protein [BD1-7 clade bacterium]
MTPSQQDLNALKNFFLLYRHRSVTRAAHAAGITQPSMSRALNKLREAYSDRLFVRQKDQLVPTAKAEHMMLQLAPLFDQINDVMDTLERFSPDEATGDFHFSAPEFISKFAMENMPTGLLNAAPKLAFFYHYWAADCATQLQQGHMDLAFGFLRECPNHVKQHVIADDQLAVVCSPDSSHCANDVLMSPEYLTKCPHVVLRQSGVMDDQVDRDLAAVGLHRHKAVLTPDIEAAFKLCMKSDYLMIAPAKLAQYFAPTAVLKRYPLGNANITYSLYWGAVKDQNPLHQFIRQSIIDAFAKHWPHFH